jgi:hypothetical protein
MALGPDETICKQEYIETMRARMEADNPGSGKNMDEPDVQKTFDTFAQVLYRVATLHAETRSDATTDAHYWSWIAAVGDWLSAMAVWQNGIRQAFTSWAPVHPVDQALQSAVLQLASPGPVPAPPSALRGKVQ